MEREEDVKKRGEEPRGCEAKKYKGGEGGSVFEM